MRAIAAAVLTCLLFLPACGGSGDEEEARAGGAPAGEERSDATELSPFSVMPRRDAIPVEGSDGRTHVLYELEVRNQSPLELEARQVAISAPDGTEILTLDEAATADALALPDARRGNDTLASGQAGRLFLTLAFDSADEIPDELVNEVTFAAEPLPEGFTSEGVSVPVDKDFEAPVLGPPLEAGKGYVAADGCCHSERHIRAALTIGNSTFVAQRWAIDWEQLDADGRFLQGDPRDPVSYAIYGKKVLAAADGEVVHVVDGLEDQVAGELPARGELPLDEADGNSVVIDIDDGPYMLYAHMQPGSLKVSEGDTVSKGDVIGLVGNTGNTLAPHLHFHVMDGPSPLASSGLPYVLEAFETTGKIPSTEVFDRVETTSRKAPITSVPGEGRNIDQLPLDLTVVDFP